MLSEEQIGMLSTRVSVLRRELTDSLEMFGGGSEQTIEQELAEASEALKNDQENNELAEIVLGLSKASKLMKLITIMQEWITKRYINK